MRIITAIKIIISVLIISLAAMFFLQNRVAVDVFLPFGKTTHFGLIYLLLISFIFGVLTSVLVMVVINGKIKKRLKQEESEDLIEEE